MSTETKIETMETMWTVDIKTTGFKLVSKKFFLENYAAVDWHFFVKGVHDVTISDRRINQIPLNFSVHVEAGGFLRSKALGRTGNTVADAAATAFRNVIQRKPARNQKSFLKRVLLSAVGHVEDSDTTEQKNIATHLNETLLAMNEEFEKGVVGSLMENEPVFDTLETTLGKTLITVKKTSEELPKSIMIPQTMPKIGDRWYVASIHVDRDGVEYVTAKIATYEVSSVAFSRLVEVGNIAPIAVFDVKADKIGAEEGDRYAEWQFQTSNKISDDSGPIELCKPFIHLNAFAFRLLEDARFWLKDAAKELTKTAESPIDIDPDRKA